MNIVYAKKFRLPDQAANMIQGLNMVASFVKTGALVNSLISFADEISDRNFYLQKTYGLSENSLGNSTFISKRARGIRYSMWLIRSIFGQFPTPVVFTRENTELNKALLLRSISRRPIQIIHEVHKITSFEPSDKGNNHRKKNDIFKKLSQANGLIFIDENLRDRVLAELNLETPSLVAPSGVNIAAFSSRYTNLPSPEIVLGYFGNITEEKGVFLLADALRHLPKKYRLKCVGRVTPETRSEMLRRIDNDTQRINFTGYLNPADLPNAMSDVHISVIPSISHNKFLSPLKLAESLALGLPIVCTPVEHLKRLVQNNRHAIFADSFHPHDLAKAISKLGNAPDTLSRMSIENRAHAQLFSWDARARHIIEFIKSLPVRR
jgi:glycosyltransferase involved in cell wall biosynthesis